MKDEREENERRRPEAEPSTPPEDDSEMWEPPVPARPLGPEGVPKEDDPGPDA